MSAPDARDVIAEALMSDRMSVDVPDVPDVDLTQEALPVTDLAKIAAQVALDALAEAGYVVIEAAPMGIMHVCPDCGSKRCPKAKDHDRACSEVGDRRE